MNGRSFELTAGPLTSLDFDVVRFNGREEISRPATFDIVVEIGIGDTRRLAKDLLGTGARLSFRTEAGVARRVSGIVRRVSAVRAQLGSEHPRYRLSIVSRYWILKKRKNCRIFQDRSVPAIVASVLDANRIEYELRLTRPYPSRPYCLQYHESDLQFVERLLAEEGIFFFFEDPPAGGADEATETMIVGDSSDAYRELEGGANLPFRPHGGMVTAVDAVERIDPELRLRSGALLVKRYDYTRPNFQLESSARVARPGEFDEGELSIYDYNFELEDSKERSTEAETRLEQLQRGRERVLGETRSRKLAPGRTFAATGHADDASNGAYVVTTARHEGRQPRGANDQVDEVYRCRFTALPASLAARPKRRERNLQQVVETATVVGPPGEEIHTDELARIKVQFHWDRQGQRDDRSSCWIRVMHPWAGAAWGFQFIPRVGMEVVVSFPGGDADRPLVLGAVYNGSSPPPFALPSDKTKSGIRTRSTPGGEGANELVFDDAAGSEQVYLHAQRDFDEMVEKDHRRVVGGNETIDITGARETTVAKDHVRTVLGNEILTVDRNMVVHVVGRQIIQIDGKPTASGAVGDAELRGSSGPGASDTKTDQAKSEGAQASLLPSPSPARSLLEAKLVWFVARLPRAQAQAGEELENTVTNAANLVGSFRVRAEELMEKGQNLTDPGRPSGMGPLLSFERATDRLRAEGAVHIESLGGLIEATHHTEANPSLAAAGAAARECLQDSAAELDAVSSAMERSKRDVLRTRGIQPAAGPLAGAGFVTGSGGGGGGATEGFKDVGSMKFKGPPTNFGERPDVPVDGGSSMKITGGGEIVSADGFRISAEGCSIELFKGVVTINATLIELDAKTIKLAAPTIEMNSQNTNITGTALVEVHGGLIKLN